MLSTKQYNAPTLRVITIKSEKGYAVSDFTINASSDKDSETTPLRNGNESSVYTTEEWTW